MCTKERVRVRVRVRVARETARISVGRICHYGEDLRARERSALRPPSTGARLSGDGAGAHPAHRAREPAPAGAGVVPRAARGLPPLIPLADIQYALEA
jgi:hypothetical protein